MTIERVAEIVSGAGIYGRPLRQVLATLDGPGASLDTLVADNAVPRRTVEDLLDAVGADLDRRDSRFSFRGDRVAEYRERFDFDQLRRTEMADPLAERLRQHAALVDRLDELIRTAPRPKQSLDHVSATAETIARRALWLDSTFDLAGAHLLCVGDHDMTSLATAMVCPAVTITVVDIDERILAFIATAARQRGLSIRCLYADFRFGLPPSTAAVADLIVTDPPYTPEGVRLFLTRGIQALRDTEHARLLMAYGYSPRHPTLGLQVQRAISGLHLTLEGILPHFNRYHGAQAIGSAADWYICRATPKSRRAVQNSADGDAHNIYTHGAQSVEAADGDLGEIARTLLSEIGGSVTMVGTRWPKEVAARNRLSLATVLGSGVPTARGRDDDATVVVDLSDDPGSWLLRVLLAANSSRLVILVPNRHPDIRDQAAQTALRSLTSAKYHLRYRRSWPGSRYAVVDAERVEADALGGFERIVNRLLRRAHGKVGNVWREALVKDLGTMTKNQARVSIRESGVDPGLLDYTLLELSRGDIEMLFEGIRLR